MPPLFTIGPYLVAEETVGPRSGLTKRWRVRPNRPQSAVVGEVKWYAQWRCYAFFPVVTISTVFEHDCLRALADFTHRKTVEHREENAKRKLLEEQP